MDHETPRIRGENNKCLSCHHRDSIHLFVAQSLNLQLSHSHPIDCFTYQLGTPETVAQITTTTSAKQKKPWILRSIWTQAVLIKHDILDITSHFQWYTQNTKTKLTTNSSEQILTPRKKQHSSRGQGMFWERPSKYWNAFWCCMVLLYLGKLSTCIFHVTFYVSEWEKVCRHWGISLKTCWLSYQSFLFHGFFWGVQPATTSHTFRECLEPRVSSRLPWKNILMDFSTWKLLLSEGSLKNKYAGAYTVIVYLYF